MFQDSRFSLSLVLWKAVSQREISRPDGTLKIKRPRGAFVIFLYAEIASTLNFSPDNGETRSIYM